VKWAVAFAALSLAAPPPLLGQNLTERPPNLQGTWTLPVGHPLFVLSHRFELIEGGDELFSVPTFGLGVGLPWGLAVGLDFTTFSEVIPARLTANEAQYWIRGRVPAPGRSELAVIGAYNGAARSADAAITGRLPAGRAQLFAEGRAFSSLFGSGEAGAAAAAGAGLRLTENLSLTGDYGRVVTSDTFPGAWSAAVAVRIPASPHTFSLQATNGGATTLQGASRSKTVGPGRVRYGFSFTIPLGGRARWSRIFQAAPVPATSGTPGEATVRLTQLSYAPASVTVRAGHPVEWVNADPVPHDVTFTDGWRSPLLEEGDRFRIVFDRPGTYRYHCTPHPGMIGTVVVLP
jgi:plastocyanin